MQITEKLRHEILFALPKMSVKQVNKICKDTKVSPMTVWRQWKKLRGQDPVFENPVVLAIAQLAAKKKVSVVSRHKKLSDIEQQLTAIQ